MKSMKNLSMNKVLGSLKRKPTVRASGSDANNNQDTQAAAARVAPRDGDSPETIAQNSVRAFCEAGGNVKGDEVLFLPAIVDAAESSPAAATECARQIRKIMAKDYFAKPSWQYNAIMLLRILTQNPGATFTRNLDQKFAEAAKNMLRNARDGSVRQMLMETLDEFEHARAWDENLTTLIQMWQKEKAKIMREYGGSPLPPPRPNFPTANSGSGAQQNYFSRSHSNKKLPDAVELSSRLEEARTSAKLLEQVVMNTPPAEVLENELIKEFADRCLSASRSIQGYMVSTNPAPDNDTMESLIDTNEQLQTALNQHQRAVLNARKQLGLNERLEGESPELEDNPVPVAALDMAPTNGSGKGKQTDDFRPLASRPGQASGSGSGSGSQTQTTSKADAGQSTQGKERHENPFADSYEESHEEHQVAELGTHNDYDYNRHAAEPFNPGFKPAETTPSLLGSAAGGSSGGAGAAPGQRQVNTDNSDEEDLYESTPIRGKEPMHRY